MRALSIVGAAAFAATSVLACAAGGSAEASLSKGACLEQIGEMRGDYIVELNPGLSLTHRQLAGKNFFVLLRPSKVGDTCPAGNHVVVDILQMPDLVQGEWTPISFDCNDSTGLLVPGGAAIGIFSGDGSNPARLGWMVDKKRQKFQSVTGLVCHSYN